MKSYLDLLRKIKEEGKHVIDRTGVLKGSTCSMSILTTIT